MFATLQVFVISAPIVTLVGSLLVPIVNGIVTKFTLSSFAKGVITIIMEAVLACLATNADATGAAVISFQTLYTFVFGLVVAETAYAKLYKPVGLTSTPQPDVSPKLLPSFGIGPDTAEVVRVEKVT